jgi:hypothetical protein
MYVDEDMLDQIVWPKEYKAEKYYAKFGGRVVGPYDTEKDAYHDTKGDVEWIKTGENMLDQINTPTPAMTVETRFRTIDDELEFTKEVVEKYRGHDAELLARIYDLRVMIKERLHEFE